MSVCKPIALGWLLLSCFLARGADWYVAPDGKGTNSGTKESPWDIASAVNGRKEVRRVTRSGLRRAPIDGGRTNCSTFDWQAWRRSPFMYSRPVANGFASTAVWPCKAPRPCLDSGSGDLRLGAAAGQAGQCRLQSGGPQAAVGWPAHARRQGLQVYRSRHPQLQSRHQLLGRRGQPGDLWLHYLRQRLARRGSRPRALYLHTKRRGREDHLQLHHDLPLRGQLHDARLWLRAGLCEQLPGDGEHLLRSRPVPNRGQPTQPRHPRVPQLSLRHRHEDRLHGTIQRGLRHPQQYHR